MSITFVSNLVWTLYVHRYAEEKIRTLESEGKLTRRSRLAKWTAVTLPELLGFLAIVLNMGLIHVPELEDYWKVSWVCEIPFFSRVLPRDRFELIFWMLHVGPPAPEQYLDVYGSRNVRFSLLSVW